jgi:hypothetical protein
VGCEARRCATMGSSTAPTHAALTPSCCTPSFRGSQFSRACTSRRIGCNERLSSTRGRVRILCTAPLILFTGAATLPHNLHIYVSAKPPCRPAIYASAAAAAARSALRRAIPSEIAAPRFAVVKSCCSGDSASSCGAALVHPGC